MAISPRQISAENVGRRGGEGRNWGLTFSRYKKLTALATSRSQSIYHPGGWSRDGSMPDTRVLELRPKSADSEKVTINLGFVDLGHIDLLVQEGFYSNRTDFIRTAIRNQLDRQNDAVKQSVAR